MQHASPNRSRRRSRPGIVAILVAALLLLLLSHPLIHGDGVTYFMYLDSVANDGDLDLSNQVARFAPAIVYPFALSKVTGTPVTPFAFGSAILLAPFYQIGRWLEPLVPALRAYPEHFTVVQGLSLAFSLMAALGAHLYGLAAVGLAYRAARRIAPGWAAGLAAVCCLAGTPLLYYATVEPLDAHIYGAFALALAMWLAMRAYGSSATTRRAFTIGLALGLAVLVRWQLLLYALPTGLAIIWMAWQAGLHSPLSLGEARSRESRSSAHALVVALAMLAGLGLYCGLCALYFWRFFGAPLLVPNDVITGRPFVSAPLRYLPQVLLARQSGWLSWSPIAALGLAGLAGMAISCRGHWRALAIAGLAGIALQVALNASIDEWYAGWAFGQRRMAEAYPLLVVGVAWLAGRPRWGRVLAVAAIACALYGGLLLTAHLYYTHTSGNPAGGGLAEITGWLLSGPHSPTPFEVFRDRYGPWSWAKPQL